MEKIPKIIKEYRIIPILSLAFVMSLLNDVVQYALLPRDTMDMGIATMITGLSAALVGLVKFIFDLMVKDKDENKIQKEE